MENNDEKLAELVEFLRPRLEYIQKCASGKDGEVLIDMAVDEACCSMLNKIKDVTSRKPRMEEEDSIKVQVDRLRDALEVARQTIDRLRTAEGTKPCPKECGDCFGVETGCYILRAIGVINRALDGSREILGRPPMEDEFENGVPQWCWECGNDHCKLNRLDTMMVCDSFERRSKGDLEADPHFGGHGND